MTETPDIRDDDDRILAAEYVLGLMTPAQHRAFEERLGGDAALRALVAAWAEDFVDLTRDIPEHAPPQDLWRAIEARLDQPMTQTPRRPWYVSLLGYAVGGVAAAALAWFVVTSQTLTPPVPEFAAQIAAEDASIQFAAAYDVDTGTLQVQRQSGAAAPGRALEFWLIADGDAPVSILVWPDGGESEAVTLPAELGAKLPGAVLAISDEPPGGSPTGQPTGAVLAVGQVQEV
ncbi:anti-sigma factor domain-containing protein [Pseudooceanicola sp. MF1-13]|uniref:anti-sigma factor n=1 Tax=Pseudooceanicola sp. MF1-13 TaxID=3379095 RepID=UPI003892C3DA